MFPYVHVTKTLLLQQFEKFFDLFNYIFNLMLDKKALIMVDSFLAQKNLTKFMELYFGHILMPVKFENHKHYRTFYTNQFYPMWFNFDKIITSVLCLDKF